MIIGPFLPWVTAAGFFDVSGFQTSTVDAAILISLGVISLVPTLKSLGQRRDEGWLLNSFTGAIAGLVSHNHYYALTHELIPATSVFTSLGAGVFVCLGGAVLVFMNDALGIQIPNKI